MTAAQSSCTLEFQLEAMLAEPMESARQREQNSFDQLAAPFQNRLVLFGAGQFGRRILRGLRSVGIEPLAFCDNNQALWGHTVDGLQVMAPAEAASIHGQSSAFLITIWNGNLPDRTSQRVDQLRKLGCAKVVPFGFLFWKYPSAFLPFYPVDLPHKVLEQADEVREVFHLWQDDFSRREYLAQIAFRLHHNFDGMSLPAPGEHYFPTDLYRLNDDEVLVDCGAYDGDTLRSFLNRQGNRFVRILAYEPDALNCAKLRAHVDSLEEPLRRRISCYQQAVDAQRGVLAFEATGTELSASGRGSIQVEAVKLDDALAGVTPTILKFDIEGAELGALQGGRQTIQRSHPILAVSAYHSQSDLWNIPLFVSALWPDYRFYLRPHGHEGWDLVCYAIPPGRTLPAAEEMPS